MQRECQLVVGGFGIFLLLLVISVNLVPTLSLASPSYDSAASIQSQASLAGKEYMDKLRSMSQLPKVGKCWKAALENLAVSCKQLDEDVQARLALKFTSCLNEMTKFSPPIICDESTPLDSCTKALDAYGRTTFTDFFLQTQNMCFFLQSEIWREATDYTVEKLANTASFVSQNLVDSEERQKRILESQEHSEKIQSGLMKDQNTLFNVVVRFKDIFDDFRVSVDDHRMIFADIFEKLSRTQLLVSWIQGEMSLLDMMGFYFISLIFGFIASATQRTRQARFWLVCLAILSLGGERYLYSYLDKSERNFAPEQIQEWIWFVRRAAAGCGVLILIWAAACYRDYQALNNNMLADLHGRMEILMEFVTELSKSGVTVPAQILSETKLAKCNDEISEVNAEPEINDAASEVSTNTTFSNYTNDSENLSNELAEIKEEIGQTNSSVTEEVNKKKPLFERFFGSRGVQNIENTKEFSPSASPISPHTYNLRQRKSTPLRDNPITTVEGPTAFANAIKKSRKKNQAKFVEEQSRSTNYFSSDDEF